MNARTEFQIILDSNGKPAFVVVPYAQFGALSRQRKTTHSGVPNEVVHRVFERGLSPMAAWREHLGLTQASIAKKIGITQAAYAQMERAKKPRKVTLLKVARAMGLKQDQLSW